MVLIVFAAVGLALGYLLGTTRRVFVTMALVALGSIAAQIWQLLASSDRESMTLLSRRLRPRPPRGCPMGTTRAASGSGLGRAPSRRA